MATALIFRDVCKVADLWEGDCTEFAVAGQKILLVWPNAGTIKAFQAHCPHQRAPLKSAAFDGKTLTCPAHHWVFDARTGKGVNPTNTALLEYPLRIEHGVVQVDLSAPASSCL
jgi:toluene monooxygenase system ferredoxin subunit